MATDSVIQMLQITLIGSALGLHASVIADVPEPPTNVNIAICGAWQAVISWTPSISHNVPVTHYVIFYNTSFDEAGKLAEAATVSADNSRAKVHLSPWATYSFSVRAVSELGSSNPSFASATCVTPPDIPYKHPSGVCSEDRGPGKLVIVWQPMELIELNGEGFRYQVRYRPLQGSGAQEVLVHVYDWRAGELVITTDRVFQEYEISVAAENDMGMAPRFTLMQRMGFSGEDTPVVTVSNFRVDAMTVNGTSAEFTWDPVQDDPLTVKGQFRGYQIQFWRESNPEYVRSVDVIINELEECPLMGYSMHRRQVSEMRAHVNNLWPYSTITAGVAVLNGHRRGNLGHTISFMTPEDF